MGAESCIFSCFYLQAHHHYSVATYISGFVIGVAPLVVTVLSPVIGFFVSHLALVTKLNSLLLAHYKFFTLYCSFLIWD